MKFEYLIVLALTLAGPFVLSFSKRLSIYNRIPHLVISILGMCIPFWVWDIAVTERGHWSFNSNYVVGPTIIGMPIEEYLFFIVIGFNSIFTWEALKALANGKGDV